MFANLESFSIFFFACLSLIVLAIFFEDKLIALEAKRIKKKEEARISAKAKRTASSQVKRHTTAAAPARKVPAQKSARHHIAA